MTGLLRMLVFLSRFSRSLPYYRLTFGLVILLGILGGVGNMLLVALVNERLHVLGPTRHLLLWEFGGLCILVPLSHLLSSIMLLRLTQKSIFTMRTQLCRSILRAPMRHLEQLGAHRLLVTLTDDIGNINMALTNVPIFCMHTTIVLACLIYLTWLWRLGLVIVLGFLAAGALLYLLPMAKARRHFLQARQHWDALFKKLRALTEGTKELKLHWQRRQAFEKELAAAILALQKESFVGSSVSTAAAGWGQLLFFVFLGVALFLLPVWSRVDSRILSGYALTLLYMITPTQAVLNLLPQFSRARIAVNQVEKLGLELIEGTAHEREAELNPVAWRWLELIDVSHSYRRESEEESFVLGPINVKIVPGELLFVVGGNGSGKTTLAKLLLGLYAPETGEIRLDGETITDANRDSYRQHFAAVFTDFFLFDRLLGLEDRDLDGKARHYLEQLHLRNKLHVHQGTLSTIDLSQGQRKRLALLTAYLEDRLIYLFDEWAADQDPHFKEIFYLHLLPELKARGKTVIVISHDDRYYHIADRVLKLESGKIEFDRPARAARESLVAEVCDPEGFPEAV
jgi:putative pyoverdin transport system ATP-binding/permease protein